MITSVLIYPRRDKKKRALVGSILTTVTDTLNALNVEAFVYPELDKKFDLIISIGGDGTFLDASHIATDRDVPIFGINAGDLGFLTEVKMEETEGSLRGVISGENNKEQERLVLKVNIEREGESVFESKVINEVVLFRDPRSPMISFNLAYDSFKLADYKADGIVISTPTGSTAYNLSLNGPILFPTARNIIINAIAPHGLTHRPVVLPSKKRLEIIIKHSKNSVLTMDGGESMDVKTGDSIVIEEADNFLRFLSSPDRNFFNILSEKLHWAKRG